MRSEVRLVVIGASAGGVSALKVVVDRLPQDFPAAVCVVLHVPAGHHSRLPEIFNRARRLPAAHAADGEHLQQGRIYVAPPIITCSSIASSCTSSVDRAKIDSVPRSIRCFAPRRARTARASSASSSAARWTMGRQGCRRSKRMRIRFVRRWQPGSCPARRCWTRATAHRGRLQASGVRPQARGFGGPWRDTPQRHGCASAGWRTI
jgi:hypothetical protein